MARVRILSHDAIISKETFEVVKPPDPKNQMILEDRQGTTLQIHKDRVLPEDSAGKAAAIDLNGKYTGFCPECATGIPVENGTIECPAHGVFEVVMTSGQQPQKKSKKKSKSKGTSKKRDEQMPKETAQPAVVDLAAVAGYGTEVWTKPQLKFDHAKVDVQAHILIAEDPLRKLCFNTYDGTLGKKKTGDPIEELQLEAFKTNTAATSGKSTGKIIGYQVKGTIDDVRKQLAKAGYKKQD